MMADAWRDLVRGFDGVDPPLDLAHRVREREARLQVAQRRRGLRLPRSAGWALAAIGAAAVVGALALAAHSRRDEPTAGPVVASPAELAILRHSFAPGSGWSPYPGTNGSGPTLPFPFPRPDSPLASARNLDSMWVSERYVVAIWTSGVVEVVTPFQCDCSAARYFQSQRFPAAFSRITIGGEPAVAIAARPHAILIGPTLPGAHRYGSPSSVQLIRGGLDVEFYQYGAGTLPGLLNVARTLRPDDGFGQIIDDARMVITGGTEEQQKLLRSIVRGIDSNDVPKVEIGSPPAPYRAKGHTWLTFRLSGLQDRSYLGIWETWLAAGAFRELSRSRGLPDVHGFGQSFADSVPGKEETDTFPPDASHPTSAIPAETLSASIRRNLAKADLTLVSLRFAKPFNLAPIVIARTDDPTAGRDGWTPKGYPIADDSQLEGSFFEVVNGSGKMVYFVAHATRMQAGMSTVGVGSGKWH
jgi:hypothetical protein